VNRDVRYINYFQVGQNAGEFLLDLGHYHPDLGRVQWHSRVVTGPIYAKLLSGALRDAVARHEKAHGPISGSADDFDPLELVKQSIADFDKGPLARDARGTKRSR
jgi:hypothetical protein